MAKITVDLTEAVDFSTIPPGEYKVRITGEEVKTSKNTGVPMVAWKLTIFGAEGDAERYNGRTLFHTTVLRGKGSGLYRSLYAATEGIEEKDVPERLDCDSEDFLSKEVLATVGVRVFEGKEQNKVEAVAVIPA